MCVFVVDMVVLVVVMVCLMCVCFASFYVVYYEFDNGVWNVCVESFL